jgi:hypothetical protein
MKKVILFLQIFALLLIINLASASECDLSVSLVNQDPYPAIPGEYVKVVFQVEGVANPTCEGTNLELIETYPFSLDIGQSATTRINSETFALDYENYLLAPYKLRVDKNAIDGENEIELFFSSGEQSLSFRELFDINIEDARSDFEVFVENYDYSTKILTLEILNIGKKDIEALTVEIPKQKNIIIKGNKYNIVGSLDKNEDTTFTYEATPSNGEINLIIYYNDEVDVRRTLQKTINYDSSFFTNRKADEKQTPTKLYFIIGIVIFILIIWIIKKMNHKNRRNKN